MLFSIETEKRTNYPFSTLKLYMNKVNLQAQFMENLLLVAYIVTLKVFYLLFINLVWYILQFIVFFCISSNWTQLHTELTLLKEIFCKNGYPENLIDKCFSKFLNNIHFVKESVPPVG